MKQNDHMCSMVKNTIWHETDQLAIYKHGQGVELSVESTEKQLQLSGQSSTWTRDLQISSPASWPLIHIASRGRRSSGQMLQIINLLIVKY